jgi:hypothetical protein
LLTAAAANGRLADAVAFGVRAQQFVADTTGMATAFLSGVYGAFGTVAWLTGADSMGELDDLVAMQMTNADYHALVAEAGPLFLPGSGTTGLIEKSTETSAATGPSIHRPHTCRARMRGRVP